MSGQIYYKSPKRRTGWARCDGQKVWVARDSNGRPLIFTSREAWRARARARSVD